MVDEVDCHAAFNVTASGEFSSKRSGEGLSRLADDQQELLPDFRIQLVDQDDFDLDLSWLMFWSLGIIIRMMVEVGS